MATVCANIGSARFLAVKERSGEGMLRQGTATGGRLQRLEQNRQKSRLAAARVRDSLLLRADASSEEDGEPDERSAAEEKELHVVAAAASSCSTENREKGIPSTRSHLLPSVKIWTGPNGYL